MSLKKINCTFLFAIITCIFNAQNSEIKNYSLQECIEHALKNNENIKTANFNIEYQKQFKKASTEIPKTSVLYTQGQFNSIYPYDNNITISQTLPNPMVFSSHNSLAKAQIKSSEFKYNATKADLIYQIKVSYYSLLYSNAVHEVILREDSIYTSFSKAVALKFSNGQSTLLENTSAETQLMETKNEVIESEEDINNFQIQLQTLMHAHVDVNAKNPNFDKEYLSVKLTDDSITDHPLLKHLQQQILVNSKTKSLEIAKILPDFVGGYFNQTIYGPGNIFGSDYFITTKDRLQGFIVGVTLPLWFYPQKSKIKAAKINTQLAQSDYNYNATMLTGQYKQAVTMYLKYRNSINYYKTNVLEKLEIIFDQALKSYNAKEISYVEYLQVVSHALSIKRNYLNVIHQNNLNVLKIEYLLAK